MKPRKGEIPVRMILFRAGLHNRISLRSGVRYLNREGYFWYRPRHKPELTAEEIQRQQDILKRLDLPTAAHIDTSISIERTIEEALGVIGPRLLGEPPLRSSAP